MDNNTMEVKKELGVASEVRKQEEIISNLLGLTEEILKVLRGCQPEEERQCFKNDCMLDTLKMNSSNLKTLDRNINEIAGRILG